jgi:DNA-binding NtrC family response regulator
MATAVNPMPSTFDAVEEEFESTIRLVEPRARILSVSECQTDHTALRRIVDNTQWRLSTAASCHDVLEKLCYIYPLVVFTDCTLPDGNWKDVLELILRFDQPYSLLVVTTRLVDDRLWSEVLSHGGFDVLTKPLVEKEVHRVLDSAWMHRGHPVKNTRILRAGS